MYGIRDSRNIILILAILGSTPGSIVAGLPVTPNKDIKGNVEQSKSSTLIAHHCQARCNGRGLIILNETRCPIGSENADDIYLDCWCAPECVPCKEEGEE
ncbi:unnamed protein product [Fusarium fujikuroi]|nr:unnamed protein product [Fusarium fujikuroi]